MGRVPHQRCSLTVRPYRFVGTQVGLLLNRQPDDWRQSGLVSLSLSPLEGIPRVQQIGRLVLCCCNDLANCVARRDCKCHSAELLTLTLPWSLTNEDNRRHG